MQIDASSCSGSCGIRTDVPVPIFSDVPYQFSASFLPLGSAAEVVLQIEWLLESGHSDIESRYGMLTEPNQWQRVSISADPPDDAVAAILKVGLTGTAGNDLLVDSLDFRMDGPYVLPWMTPGQYGNYDGIFEEYEIEARELKEQIIESLLGGAQGFLGHPSFGWEGGDFRAMVQVKELIRPYETIIADGTPIPGASLTSLNEWINTRGMTYNGDALLLTSAYSRDITEGEIRFATDYPGTLWRLSETGVPSFEASTDAPMTLSFTATIPPGDAQTSRAQLYYFQRSQPQASVLSVTLPATSAREGDGTLSAPGTVTITEARADDFVIELASSDLSELVLPSDVRILARQTSAHFDVTIVDDDEPDDIQTVRVTVHAPNCLPSEATIHVRDNDLTYFGISEVHSPTRVAENTPLTIKAYNANHEWLANHDGTAALAVVDATEQLVAIEIIPDSIALVGGIWTGDVQLMDIAQGIKIRAAAGTAEGLSNAFDTYECTEAADCPDDGLFCTGNEFCDVGTGACQSSGDLCPYSACDEQADVCEAHVVFEDDFESGNSAGWTLAGPNSSASTGTWTIGDPIGTTMWGQPAQPEYPFAGLGCVYTDENPFGKVGYDDVDDGVIYLVSPTLDLSPFTSVTLSYARWFYNRDTGEDRNDFFQAEVSNDNGVTWITVEELDTHTSANE